MYIIGLTGGIASGKSTVAALFEKKGITIIDTDQLARQLTDIGQDSLQKIALHFGKNILLPDGSLNRKLLRTIIFSDNTQRLWLEQLLHPLIRTEMEQQIHSAQSEYCITVIPLLFESTPNPIINRILVVDTTEELQLKRAQTRDNISLDEAKWILLSQAKREYRLANATDIIYNTGSIDTLKEDVEKLHQLYLSLASHHLK